MTWFALSILSAIFTSFVSIIDKIVVERHLRDHWSFPLFTSAFLGIYAVALVSVRASLGLFRMPPAPILAVGLLPGILQYLASVLYTRALLRTDAATVAAINQTAPLFSVVWGWAVFGEVFGPLGYLGVILSVVCCAGLTWERTPHAGRTVNRVLFITVAGAMIRSLGDLFVKVTLTSQDYWNTFGLSRMALLPITLLLLLNRDQRLLVAHALRLNGPRLLPAMAALELLAIVPLVLSTVAYARGPLALVSAVRYTTPLFVLLLIVLLNGLRAGFVPDQAAAGSPLRRAALTAGILAGVLMLRVKA